MWVSEQSLLKYMISVAFGISYPRLLRIDKEVFWKAQYYLGTFVEKFFDTQEMQAVLFDPPLFSAFFKFIIVFYTIYVTCHYHLFWV